MKTLFACTLAAASLLGFTGCDSDDVSRTVHTTTTTEETVQQRPSTSATTVIRWRSFTLAKSISIRPD